jgi:hypothetical protein
MAMTGAEVAYTTFRNNQNGRDERTGRVLEQWAGLPEWHQHLWAAVAEAVRIHQDTQLAALVYTVLTLDDPPLTSLEHAQARIAQAIDAARAVAS